jgi:hypothetical protein
MAKNGLYRASLEVTTDKEAERGGKEDRNDSEGKARKDTYFIAQLLGKMLGRRSEQVPK